MSQVKKEALGKGIRALLQSIDKEISTPTTNPQNPKELVQATTATDFINISDVEVNPYQPRQDFDEKALNDLATSIKVHGIIQPITVAKLTNNKYRLISGERRLRATQLAGLTQIPVFVRTANDQELLEMALIENIQRENLNAIEISLSYKRLMEEIELTQEQLADRVGKDRSTITNYLRLLKLPPDVQVAVRSGLISMAHARTLISVENVEQQLFVFHEILKRNLSVRQTEDLVRNFARNKTAPKKAKSSLAPAYKKIEDKLSSHFSTKVNLDMKRNGKGSLTIEFYSDEEFNKIIDQIKAF
jgi:ParB family chromosome partitioning protein